MARLLMNGFEGGDFTSDAGTGSFAGTYSTTSPHGGARCLAAQTASPASSGATQTFSGGALARDYFARAYIKKSANVANAAGVLIMRAGSGGRIAEVRLNTNGTLNLLDANATVIGSASAALNDNQWYRVELRVQVNTATTGVCELRVDGTTVTGTNVSNANLGTLAPGQISVGWMITGITSTATVYFDDVALNDGTTTTQNSWPGDGKIVHLLPTSDVGFGAGWTLGTGTAISANGWNAVDNVPPTGVADLTAGSDTKQIRNATNNANVNATFNLQTYTAAGLISTDTIQCIQPVAATGAPVATSAKSGSMGVILNPFVSTGLASFGTFYQGSTVAGTYPSGWQTKFGTMSDRSLPNLAAMTSADYGTAPQLQIQQVTASTRIAMVCSAHLRVEYQPAASGPANLTATVDGVGGTLGGGLSAPSLMTATLAGAGTLAATVSIPATPQNVTGTLAGAGSLTGALTAAPKMTAALAGAGAIIRNIGTLIGANVGGTKLADSLVAWDAGQTWTMDLDYIVPPQDGAHSAPLLGQAILGTALGANSAGHVPAVFIGTDRNLYVSMFWHGGVVVGTNVALVRANADDGVQHHLTVTYDGTSQRVYIDGALASTLAVAQTSYSGTGYSYFAGAAQMSGGWPAIGTVDANAYAYLQSGAGVSNPTFQTGVQLPSSNGGPLMTTTPKLTATLAGAGSIVGALTPQLNGTLVGQGQITGALTSHSLVTAALAGVGSLTASLTAASQTTGTLSGAGSLTGSLTTTSQLAGTLAGAGSLSGTISSAQLMSGTLAGVGQITAALTPQMRSTLAGAGSITATLSATGAALITGTLSGQGNIAGALTAAQAIPPTSLSGAGSITGALTAASQLTATVSGAGSLTGALRAPALMTGTLSGAGSLLGVMPQYVVGTLSGAGSLAGALSASSRMTGTLSGAGALAGAPTVSQQITVTFSGAGSLSGTLLVARLLTATLSGAGAISAFPTVPGVANLTAALAGQGTITPALTASPRITGTLAGAGTLTGALTAPAQIAGTLAGQGSISGALSASPRASGTLAGAGTLSGQLSASPRLSGTLSGVGSLTGVLAGPQAIPPTTLAGTGAITGALSASPKIVANLQGVGLVVGNLASVVGMATSLAGTGTISGKLTIPQQIQGALAGAGSLQANLNAPAQLQVQLLAQGQIVANLTIRTLAGVTAVLSAVGQVVADLSIAGGVDLTLPLEIRAWYVSDMIVGDTGMQGIRARGDTSLISGPDALDMRVPFEASLNE